MNDKINLSKESDNIEISFVVPAKNEEMFLGLCLSSIHETMSNTYRYEIILVDNSSTDQTIKIAEDLGCKILVNPSGKSPASSRNIGASIAKGEFIAFVDADCILDENWFEHTREHFNDKNVIAVGTKISPDFEKASWVEKTVFRLNSRRGVIKNGNSLKVKWVGTSNILVRSSAFKEVGEFNESLITAEDYNLCEKLGRLGDIILDRGTHTIHMRESKTLRELFRRELWRGQNSLSHWRKSGFGVYEAPSVVVPFVFSLFCLMAVLLCFFNVKVGLILIFLGVCMPIFMTIRSKDFALSPLPFIQGVIVSSTYLLARGVALIKEFLGMNKY